VLRVPEDYTNVEKALALRRFAGAVENALAQKKPPNNLAAMSLHAVLRPHAPAHQLGSAGTYFVTASTLHQMHHFRGRERLAVLHRGVLKVTAEFGWRLEVWAVFSNHYHFVAQSPELEEDARRLSRMLGPLHEQTAKWVNRLGSMPERQIWFNFRETTLTYEKRRRATLATAVQKSSHPNLILRPNLVS